ncbi:MAG: DUF1080 domain-containing protein [Bacteroidales bacterium]
MRRKYLVFMTVIIAVVANSCMTGMQTPNELTRAQEREGWMLMFDGETTDGWRGYNSDSFPETGWTVDDGTLFFSGRGGDIIYDQKFGNFHFKLEWRISVNGNSGIFYLAEERPGAPIWHTGLEYQLLDNEGHPDAKQGVDGNRMSASLYDILPAVPQNANTPGEWNTAEIIVNNGRVTHRQNGVDVVEFEIGTAEWDEMVEKSKFNAELFGKAKEGYIGLQDHSDDIWFRNIMIREL